MQQRPSKPEVLTGATLAPDYGQSRVVTPTSPSPDGRLRGILKKSPCPSPTYPFNTRNSISLEEAITDRPPSAATTGQSDSEECSTPSPKNAANYT